MELTIGALEYYLIGINILGFILYGINTLLYRFTENNQIDSILTIPSFLGGSLGMVLCILLRSEYLTLEKENTDRCNLPANSFFRERLNPQ